MDDPGKRSNSLHSSSPLFVHNRLSQHFQRGTKAPQAAGKIHTDFEKGFIMAEVMKFDDFKNEGSEAAVKVNAYIPYR